MPGEQAKANKLADRRIAREAAYRGSVNPFPEGTRLYRYFIKARQHVDNMDSVVRELEMGYGFPGPAETPRS